MRLIGWHDKRRTADGWININMAATAHVYWVAQLTAQHINRLQEAARLGVDVAAEPLMKQLRNV